MKRLILAAGVATLAITAPVLADPGNGKGKGGDRGAKVERGGGDRAERRSERRVERRAERRSERRGQAREQKRERVREARSERRERVRDVRSERQERVRDRREASRDRVQDRRKVQRAEKQRDRLQDRREARRDRIEDRREIVRDRSRDRREALRDRREILRERAEDRRLATVRSDWWDDRFDDRFDERVVRARYIDGCPPGLAKKSPACIPPGQAKKWIGQRVNRLDSAYAMPLALRDIFRDDDDYYYRYNDGYAYRVNRDNDLIRALMPLFGGGLLVGQQYPYGYNSPYYAMPSYYQPFYQSGADDYYRYNNGYVYEIDRSSGMIEDIIPMYDHGYGVGQMLPASYSYYNVPYQYRSWYPDSGDYSYRYAPGAIYQVDRDTQLITAIAALLTGNNSLAVGQRLPMSYNAYNVPFAYRDRYYDTPDSWYRYSNGNIYQVDPQTRLITALISAIV